MTALGKGELGTRAARTFETIGTALLLLTEVGTCEWGCRGGDHIVENLVRRMSNYAFACLRLSAFGLYDEALGSVRSLAEIGNLLQLFAVKPVELERWMQLPQRERHKHYTPVKVRLALEETEATPITTKQSYAKLCEFGVHVTPSSARFSHDLDYSVYFGGSFLAPAFLLVLNQLSGVIAPALPIAGVLISAPQDKMKNLEDAGLALLESSSWLNVENYEEFFEKTRREFIQNELSTMGQKAWEAVVEEVLSELADHGQLPEGAENLTTDEAESLVYPRIAQKVLRKASNARNPEKDHD